MLFRSTAVIHERGKVAVVHCPDIGAIGDELIEAIVECHVAQQRNAVLARGRIDRDDCPCARERRAVERQ